MNVLISGSGIAGAAAALYLHRDGHNVTMIDKAHSFQPAGYALALKSFGLRVVADLGLLDAVQRSTIPIDTVHILESNGDLIKAVDARAMAGAAKGAAMVYRSDLQRILYTAASADAPVHFGKEVAQIVQDDSGVQVAFSDGTFGRFDLLIIAEGVRSRTRALVWGEGGVHRFDVTYAAGRIEHGIAPSKALLWYLGMGTSLTLIPVDGQRTLVQAYCRGVADVTDSKAEVQRLLAGRFENFDAGARRVLEQLEADGELFCDSVAMVTIPDLTRGRVVLLGDAGYCPTFLSGMGASLALIGAKALQQSMHAAGSNVDAGLLAYNALLQPLIHRFQANAQDHLNSFLTSSRTSLWIRDKIMHAIPQSILGWAFGHPYDAEASLVNRIMSA